MNGKTNCDSGEMGRCSCAVCVIVRKPSSLAESWDDGDLRSLDPGGAVVRDRTIPMERPSENIALRASYTMEPKPNYDLCSDPGDAEQLTDGVYTEGYFWAQKSTVG